MVYHGQIKNGEIVLDEVVRLPEGAKVRVDVMTNGDVLRSDEVAPGAIWSKLLKLAGTVEGLPPDAARRVDDYLYGSQNDD